MIPALVELLVRVVFPLAMAGVFVGFVVWLVRSNRPRVPTLGLARPGELGATSLTSGPPPAGQWNAKVDQAGGGLHPWSGFGQVSLADGMLAFVPDGEPAPRWRVPVAGMVAGKNIAVLSAEVWLSEPSLGRLALTVSRERINRVSDNDLKDIRERRYADEFLYALHLAGARIDPGS